MDEVVRDAGYSWVILLVVSIEYSLVGMSLGCVGVLYPEFVEHMNSSKHATGWIGSLNISVGAFVGKRIIFGAELHCFLKIECQLASRN